MIPETIARAAEQGGWRTVAVFSKRGTLWIELDRGDLSILIKHDRWRHTSARAFRGRGLMAILRGQYQIAKFLAP